MLGSLTSVISDYTRLTLM